MTRFIGLDYSLTSCGVAIVEGEHWQTYTIKSRPNGDRLSDFYGRVQDLAFDVVATLDLRLGDVLAVEGIAFAARGQKVDRLHFAWHRTFELLTKLQQGVEPFVITTNQVKQLATGKGNSSKDEVLLSTERRLPQAEVRGNDEADAVWVAVGGSILTGSPVISLPAAHVPPAIRKAAA